jgi:hypothetical protein
MHGSLTEHEFRAHRELRVIGNMQLIALVGMNGSIDFLCYPDF